MLPPSLYIFCWVGSDVFFFFNLFSFYVCSSAVGVKSVFDVHRLCYLPTYLGKVKIGIVLTRCKVRLARFPMSGRVPIDLTHSIFTCNTFVQPLLVTFR